MAIRKAERFWIFHEAVADVIFFLHFCFVFFAFFSVLFYDIFNIEDPGWVYNHRVDRMIFQVSFGRQSVMDEWYVLTLFSCWFLSKWSHSPRYATYTFSFVILDPFFYHFKRYMEFFRSNIGIKKANTTGVAWQLQRRAVFSYT